GNELHALDRDLVDLAGRVQARRKEKRRSEQERSSKGAVAHGGLVLLAAELARDHLGMVQMSLDSRPHLLDQSLELRVLRARNEGLVDRVEDRLVVGHLVIDISLVELRTLQLLQAVHVLRGAFLEAPARVVVLGLDAELLRQRSR